MVSVTRDLRIVRENFAFSPFSRFSFIFAASSDAVDLFLAYNLRLKTYYGVYLSSKSDVIFEFHDYRNGLNSLPDTKIALTSLEIILDLSV